MKRFISWLLVVIMMAGSVSFAEGTQNSEDVHQLYLEELLAQADVELSKSDMTVYGLRFLADSVSKMFLEKVRLSDEERDELNAVRTAIFAELKKMEDEEAFIEFFNTSIDGMQSQNAAEKAKIKSGFFEVIVQRMRLNEAEKALFETLLPALRDAVDAADEEEYEAIKTAVMANLEAMSFDPHDVRDDLMMVYNCIESKQGEADSEESREILFETIHSLSQEKAFAIALQILYTGWAWNVDEELLDTAFVDELESSGIDWANASAEDRESIAEIVAAIMETYGEYAAETDRTVVEAEEYTEYFAKLMQVWGSLTEEEEAAAKQLREGLIAYLKAGTEEEFVELKHLMEKLVSEIKVNCKDFDTAVMELLAINNGDQADERLVAFESMSSVAKTVLFQLFMDAYQISKVYAEEELHQFDQNNARIAEATAHLDIKGRETDAAVVAELEKIVGDIINAEYDEVGPIIKAYITCGIVDDVLCLGTLSEAERELFANAHKNLAGLLAEGDPEKLDMLEELYHALMHRLSEGSF